MRTAVVAIVLAGLFLAACESTGSPSAPRATGDAGRAGFTTAERAIMDNAWRAFKQRDPDWPRLRGQWLVLGPKATDSLVENLFRAMVLSQLLGAPEWFDKAREELALLGDRAVPVLGGVLAEPTFPDPETGEATLLPNEITGAVVDLLVGAGPDGLRALADAVGSEVASVRRSAALGLGRAKDPSALPPLSRLIKTGPHWVDRASGVKAVSLIPGRGSEDILVGALGDRDADVVIEAAKALVGLRCARALPALQARVALAEQQGDVRTAMALNNAAKMLGGRR